MPRSLILTVNRIRSRMRGLKHEPDERSKSAKHRTMRGLKRPSDTDP
ncbi:MAG: hypothetical protein ACXAC5_00640 [Promethearchaeota archaeon]